MRGSSIHLATDAHGQLCVELPRSTYWMLAAVLALAAGLMPTRWGAAVASGLEAPAWAWWGVMALFAAFAAAFAVQARWGRPLVFHRARAAIVRGERTLARFADVSHVEIVERRSEDRYRYWVLRVHRADGRPIFLGRDSAKDEADRAAARVATALGKPVKFVVR